MKTEEKLNMTMLCDFYELTMGNGYFQTGFKDRITYFDVYFRSVPDGGGFAIAAGLEQLIEYIEDLHFDEQDIAYLRGKGIFCEEFLEYLRTFRFTGDIYAVPEGTPVFPKEPMVIVRAPAIEAQLVETFALLTVNHQSLIATKANRIARAAKGRGVMEFGSRRAQGTAAAIVGARAAYIGGCIGTACTITDELYGVPALGTMAHAWVQMFDTEYDAFKTYCELYPGNAIMLVDTYDTLHSGIPNAIRAFDEVLRPKGITKCGIRLDSGDIAYLSRKAREMLDEAGWETATITVSNSLDEYIIRDMWMQDAKIDSFGVGERLIADYLCVYDETVDDSDKMTIFDPEATWKRKEVYHFEARELLVPIFKNGELVYKQPSLEEIRAYCAAQVDTLWDEVKRFDNPHRYYVDLSQKLYDIKQELLTKNGNH